MSEQTVWITARRNNGGPGTVYHTDPECPNLDQASTVFDKPLNTLADWRDECKVCAGTANRGTGVGSGHIESLRQAAREGNSP